MATASRKHALIRPVAGLLSLLMTVAGAEVVLSGPAVATPQAKAPAPTCPDDRTDAASAALTARLCGKRVEVTDARTERTQLWALPHGGFESQIYAGPVRFKQGDEWKPVDLTLKEQADGSIAPVGHPHGLKLSGQAIDAGEHALATVDAGGDALSMAWTGVLPKPVLSGNTATYREALLGVDLVLTATRTGFEQSFVAKDRAAALRVASVTIPLRSNALRFVGDGPASFAIKDATGAVKGRVPTPLMWDAQRGDHGQVLREQPLTVKARPRTAQKGAAVKAGTDAAAGSGAVALDLSADPAWLADPATRYPVTIDPQVDLDPQGDTFVRNDSTADRSGANEIEFGKANAYTAHGYLTWPTADLAGAHVNAASLHLWNWYAGNCSQNGWLAYTTQPYSDPLTWANQPAIIAQAGYSTETHGFNSTCDDDWIGMDVTAFAQYAADNRLATGYMALMAYNETTVNGWKQVRSLQAAASSQIPYLTVNYDAAPIVTNQQTSPATAGCVTGAGRPWISSATPKLQATVSDADSATVNVTFDWAQAGSSTVLGSQTLTGVASNTVPSVTVPAGQFAEGGSYQWRVSATDGTHTSGTAAWCEFSVDTVRPGVPSVSSSVYPSVAVSNTWNHGGAGVPGQFTFTPTGLNPPVAGATASSAATSCQPTEGPAQAVDGSNTTKWCSTDPAKWLKLTLPSMQTVTSVLLRHAGAGGEQSAWNTRDFDIQLSQDDTTYWTALQVRGNTASVTSSELAAPGPAKYVKIVIVTPTSNADPAARIYEAEVYTGTRLTATATSPNTPCAAAETADKGADGVTTTKWCTTDAGTKSLQLDLGGVQSISNVVVRHAAAGGEPDSFNTRDYDVQVSTDGSAWTTALQVRGNTAGSVNSRLPAVAQARYVKLVVLTPTQTTDPAARIPEFQVYRTIDVSDVVAYQYQQDTDTAVTTVPAGNPTALQLTPTQDGRRTLTVRAVDRAGALSDPNVYTFNAGRAGLVLPAAGASIVKRTKLAVSGDPTLTRATFEYRRGPGGAVTAIPLANLTKADGSAVTTNPVRLSDLGANGIWNAVDTLGTVGGVVQVRATLYPDLDGQPGYSTQWVTATVNPDGDGATTEDVGPGSVNLLNGDYGVSSTDTNEFGLNVSRVASSREPENGWLPQGERLTANQQQISTDTSGFDNILMNLQRMTDRGQGSSTDSLQAIPKDSYPGYTNDSYAAVGGDCCELRLGMKAGKRYRFTGWIYVPAATGLNPDFADRGLRIVAFYRDSAGNFHEYKSVKAGWVDGWQELTVDLPVGTDATAAFFRLYNGFNFGSGKAVYWDNLSLKELVAPFGPQWRGGVDGGVASVDYEQLTFPSADLAKITNTGGGYYTFGRNTSGTFFPEPGAENLNLVQVSDTVYELREADGTTTQFVQSNGAFLVSTTWTADQNSTTRYLYDSADSRTLVKRVINPVEPGVGDCTAATPARGCEVLEYDYATATTATASVYGDVLDQVRAVKVWSWDPAAAGGAGAETAVVTAQYSYDNTGRLRETWDPRASTPLKTTYSYDAAGRLTQAGSPGVLPWNFDYGTVAGDDNAGRLFKVRRSALKAGTKNQLDGDVATNIVYQVPLTRAAGGPYDMDANAVAQWAQQELPTDATAVFTAQDTPPVNAATATSPGPNGYQYATVTYLSASGRMVNTAAPGGHIDTEEHDEFDNVVRSLEATNRELALGTLPGAAGYAADLGLPADSPTRANLLSTVNRYSPDGLDLIETTEPLVRIALERNLVDPAGAEPMLPAGTVVPSRAHTVRTYDEGKPDGATYHLETTSVDGAQVAGYPLDADTRVQHTGFGAEKGGTSGWVLKKPTSVTTDAGTAYTVYDSAGRVTRAIGVGSTGTDARAVVSIYYTAGANADDALCGNKPEWAGQACVTGPGGAVTGYDPARMAGVLPTRRVEAYTRWGAPSIAAETAAGNTVRTTTTYDARDRVLTNAIASDIGTPMPTVTTTYDPVTGDVVGSTTGSVTISREYDQLGRIVTYTDADASVTHTEYDRFGHKTKSYDATGTTTYTYDRAVDPRDLITSVTDSVAGTFSAKYSPDGQLVEQHYPGGVTRKDTLDASAAPVGRVYTRDSDGAVLYAEQVVENTAGQWINDTHTGGSSTYGYDGLGQLSSARQVIGTACTTRTYGYDSRTNRVANAVFNPAADGSCRTGTPDVQQTHTYDSADRLTDAGYTYDNFGRTTALPTGLTNTYYATGMVSGQQAGSTRRDWTLDPKLRLRGYSIGTLSGGLWSTTGTETNHYADDGDEPAWISETTGTTTVTTRNVVGPDLDLAATTSSSSAGVRLQLSNLHGDVALSVDTTLTSPQFSTYDEFGVRAAGTASARYGWLGAKERSADALGDVILMGVRLYAPSIGRFLQPDPEPGGSCNAYDYACADPVNVFDLAGTSLWGAIKHAASVTVHKAVQYAGTISAVAGVVAMFTPPPIDLIAGAISLTFGVIDTIHSCANIRSSWGSCALGVAGVVPGVGALAKGAKIARAAKAAKAAKSARGAFKTGARNSRKARDLVTRTMRKAASAHKAAKRSARPWNRVGNAFTRTYGTQSACYWTPYCEHRAKHIPGGWVS